MRQILASTLMAVMTLGPLVNANAAPVRPPAKATSGEATTPIRHLVVIFQENVSFDHYFGTYPTATNPAGEPPFTAAPNTPSVNGIAGTLTTLNPNLNPANGQGATNPFRLDRSQAATADQDHDYLPEQLAFDKGLMDLFPVNTGTAASSIPPAW
jgi:phospholipase C